MAHRDAFRRTATAVVAVILFLSSCARVGSGTRYAAMEREVFALVNEYRRDQGLRELAWNDAIAEECRKHSRDMAAGRIAPGHEGAKKRFRNIRSRIAAVRFTENAALNRGYSDPARVAVEGWIASPGHRHNLTGDYGRTGVGIAVRSGGTFYITQIYIGSRDNARCSPADSTP